MAAEREQVGVVGVGWVGLVTATCFAELGHRIVAIDVNEEKVESLRRGEITIHEPGLAELLEKNAERITFTTSMDDVLSSARLLFCCVDTPPTYSGDADLSRVRSVVDQLPADSDHALVMKSTVPSGTGASIRRDKPDLAYVSCPEFLKEGSAIQDFMHPDRVVIGADAGSEDAADAVERLYTPLGGEIVRTDVASAEMIKLASNAFLATKISFINEIANVCEQTGADVTEVARGMGLDDRIGASFLRAGIGYGGSCFMPGGTLLIRRYGATKLVTYGQLWDMLAEDDELVGGEAIEPSDLFVWSWTPGEAEPEWMPVTALTKREYDGDVIEIRTKMGRRVTVTADHPFVVGDGQDDQIVSRILAEELDEECWLPLARGSSWGSEPAVMDISAVLEDELIDPADILVRPTEEGIGMLRAMSGEERTAVLQHPRGHAARMGDIGRSGTLRLEEAWRAGIKLADSRIGTAPNGTFNSTTMRTDERFWRIVGLYLAEGCVSTDSNGRGSTRHRIIWSFHPTKEEHLVAEVRDWFESNDIRVSVRTTSTSRRVEVSSRILAAWWTEVLGLGTNAYEQRIPDLIWEQSAARKRALLSGLWEGDGSWSYIRGGPSVILEWGTISDELADGVARLLGDVGLIPSWRRGRTRLSTKETHWLRVSGADQVEKAMFLVPEGGREAVLESIGRQAKRIAPTGFRTFSNGTPWVRVTGAERSAYTGPVFSLKVWGSQTVVADGGLVAHQCFPKDVSALKQLAGNSGYHFQLLNAVIEVNELQKRRVIAKLEKHLGSLVDKRIALLGLAFKPDTDDMREASSLVLSARLQGEGATVVAYDPVAEDIAASMLPDVEMAASAEAALEGADAVVLVTEWPEFSELDWVSARDSMASAVLIDGRNYLDADELRAAGFAYEGIGRPDGQSGGE